MYKRKFSPSIVSIGKHFPKDFFNPTLHHTKEASILNISDYGPVEHHGRSIQVMSGNHSNRYQNGDDCLLQDCSADDIMPFKVALPNHGQSLQKGISKSSTNINHQRKVSSQQRYSIA